MKLRFLYFGIMTVIKKMKTALKALYASEMILLCVSKF